MKLDSVRELKQLLHEKIGAKLATAVVARAAGPIETANEPPRTLAIGVAPHARGFKLAVRVQKRAMEDSRELELIKKHAKGEVDIRYVGRISKRSPVSSLWFRQRQRPLLIGASIGHHKITAGSIGCFVKLRTGGGNVIQVLSNNHVLANENRCKKGDHILQQGRYDGGVDPADSVAALTSWVKLKKNGVNFVDCAIAAVNNGIGSDLTTLRGVGRLKGLGPAVIKPGTLVTKIGRTTGVTKGKVTAFELDNVVVGYDIGDVRFDNSVEIESTTNVPFSSGGDSGSLIVDSDFLGTALLYSGSDQGGSNGLGLTYANPLHVVLDELKVDLAL